MAVLSTWSSDDEKSDAGERGKVKLPLTMVDGDEAYRIRGTFIIRDSENVQVWQHTTDETSDSSSIEVDLDPGSYTITLKDGWQLIDRNGEVYFPVLPYFFFKARSLVVSQKVVDSPHFTNG
jgi:hypothetical protein